MASPRADALAGRVQDQRADESAVETGESDSESSSGSSYLGSDAGTATPNTGVCRWRTARFGNGECERFFDCPSHTVERVVEAGPEGHQGEGEEEAIRGGQQRNNVGPEAVMPRVGSEDTRPVAMPATTSATAPTTSTAPTESSSSLPTPGRLHPEPGPRPQAGRQPSEIVLPRWQPDSDVTYCPICHAQFSIFVRKHHCR